MSMQTIKYQTDVPALDAATLCEAFQVTARSQAEQTAVRTAGDGFTMTWGEYDQRVRRTAAGLAALGVRRGDTVATMLTNRPEFHWVDIAAMHLGAQAYGLYNTSSQEELEYVLRDADTAVVVTERVFAAKMLQARGACPLAHVVSVDGGGTLTLDEVDAGGDPGFDFDAAWQAVRPSDVVTLIYTSGTTGLPKGVQITHGAVMASVRPMQQVIPAYRSGFSAISYLPTAHLTARVLQHYYSLAHGGTLTCCPDAADLGATLVDTRPTLFIGVPRVWEKIQAGLRAAIEADHDDQRRHAAEWGIDVGLRLTRVEQAGQQPSAQLLAEHERADALVLSNLRARIGLDRLEGALIGASPVPPEVIEFFWALGVPLCEAYGMTEVLIATVNPVDRVKIGTVGPPVLGMELRLAADGEVLMRSPQTMLGYRNLPRKTAEAIDPDGWVHSGDVGELDEDGYLRIVDRKKELIINDAGHNMSPANIEMRLKASGPLIGQAICVGDRRPFNVALLVLEPEAAAAFAARHGVDRAGLVHDRRVLDEVAASVDRANARLALPEQIIRWTLLDQEWLPGGDELTPTMKLRRQAIAAKYAAHIAALYSCTA